MKKKIYLFNVILVVLLSYTSASEKNENDDTESVYEDAVSSPLDLNLENKNVAEDPETTGERVPSLAEQTSRIKEHMVGWKDKPRENMMQRYIKDSPKFEKDTGVEPLGDKIVPKEDTPITDPLSLKEYSELEHLYIEEDRMDSTPLVHTDQFLNKDNITRWVEEISEEEIQEACKALCKKFGIVLPVSKITELYNNIKNYVDEVVGDIKKWQDFFENNQNIIVVVNPEKHTLIFQPLGGSAYQTFSLEDVVACYAIMPALFDKVIRQERYVNGVLSRWEYL